MSLDIACPICGAVGTRCTDSRPSYVNSIKRRRRCPRGHTFRTREVVEDEDARPADILDLSTLPADMRPPLREIYRNLAALTQER